MKININLLILFLLYPLSFTKCKKPNTEPYSLKYIDTKFHKEYSLKCILPLKCEEYPEILIYQKLNICQV